MNLNREHFIIKLEKQERRKIRGRPKSNITTERAKGEYVVEDTNYLFDFGDDKESKAFRLPPGNVKYSDLFRTIWNRLRSEEELDGISLLIFRFVSKIVRRTLESRHRYR